MKDKLRPHFPRRAKDSVSSPRTLRDALPESSTPSVHSKIPHVPHFNLTSNSNQLRAKATAGTRPRLYQEHHKKHKQTPKFVKMDTESGSLSKGQAIPINRLRTTRRESDVSAFEPKLCEELLLSQERVDVDGSQGSRKVLTPTLTKKKSNLTTFAVTSSSSLSMLNKIDLKMQSVNFNGPKKKREHADQFSHCEISSSPTIKDVNFQGGSPRRNCPPAPVEKRPQVRAEPRREESTGGKSPFPEYGSEIIGKGQKPKPMMKFTVKTHEKVRSHLPKRVKGSDELASISSMYDHTRRKEKRRKRARQAKQSNKEAGRGGRKGKRKKLKSNEHTFQKQLMSKTVSPTHTKSKRRPAKKPKVGAKHFKRLSPEVEAPAPKFPNTVAERTIRVEPEKTEKAPRRPKKVSIKNFIKSKSKLQKLGKKKKVSHQERLSAKLEKLEEYEKKNNNIKILIKNEFINNNNNHFYNLNMQKAFDAPEFPFRGSINDGTPVYSIVPTTQFVYEDFPDARPADRAPQKLYRPRLIKKGASSRLARDLSDSIPKHSLKSLNSLEHPRKNSNKERMPVNARFRAKDSFKLSKSRERPFKRKTPLKKAKLAEFGKVLQNPAKSRDFARGRAKQARVYVKYKELPEKLAEIERSGPETGEFRVSNAKARFGAQEYELGTVRGPQKMRRGKNSFKTTMERYSKKYSFKEAGKKGRSDKDARKKLKDKRQGKKGGAQVPVKEARTEPDPLFYELARKPERISFNKHKFDFKKKNKVDYNEQNNKIFIGMTLGEGGQYSRKNNKFGKKGAKGGADAKNGETGRRQAEKKVRDTSRQSYMDQKSLKKVKNVKKPKKFEDL